jgi:hypothetical protein
MDATINLSSAPEETESEVSLVRGGAFYRAQRAVRLTAEDRFNLGRRISLAIAVTLLPIILITAFLNPSGLHSLLIDYRVYARMIIAVPVLLIGEVLMEGRFRATTSYIRNAGLLDASDTAFMREVTNKLIRLRDSAIPEMLIGVLIVVYFATTYRIQLDPTPWLTYGTASDLHLTPAGWYAILVGAPLWLFLMGLALWRWLLWAFYAFKLSRRKLILVPMHPDQCGGLGFLGLSAQAFAPIAFAASTVIGSAWREEILHQGAHLMDFKITLAVLLAIIAIVAFGPLVFFLPRLAALRQDAILQYGVLGQIQGVKFHDKWLRKRAGHESEFLQAPEITTLANYANTYKNIQQLKPFPIDKASLYTLAAAVAIPALPVVLAQLPLAVVLKDLLSAAR